jgi:uncharacterized membrane protein YfcA
LAALTPADPPIPMLSVKTALLALLAIFTLGYIAIWARHLFSRTRAPGAEPAGPPTPFEALLGAVTNFFDTLGIGSFAPTTAVFKFKRMVPDEQIPGTLNVGHTLPSITQAFIFIALVQVEVVTLVALIASAVVGSWLGAGVVARWPRRKVQIGMGLALLAAAALFALRNVDEMRGTPVFAGGEALGLTGPWLAVGIIGNFMLGALMTLGIGLYAPCLIMISLLGMNPRAAFPIMMGSCAFLMPVASAKFISVGRYAVRPALGLALGGIPAVLIAAFIVKQLPLVAVRWLVMVVVLYSAAMMLASAVRESRPAAEPKPGT